MSRDIVDDSDYDAPTRYRLGRSLVTISSEAFPKPELVKRPWQRAARTSAASFDLEKSANDQHFI